jgi:hypothetical protein
MRTIAEVKADILGCIKRGEHAMEAGFPYENPLNDLQRELIAACAHQWGECWLGRVNLSRDDTEQRTIWRWSGETVLNFGARFVLPQYDMELERLIRERAAGPYLGTAVDYERIKAIHARIAELKGELLIWN